MREFITAQDAGPPGARSHHVAAILAEKLDAAVKRDPIVGLVTVIMEAPTDSAEWAEAYAEVRKELGIS